MAEMVKTGGKESGKKFNEVHRSTKTRSKRGKKNVNLRDNQITRVFSCFIYFIVVVTAFFLMRYNGYRVLCCQNRSIFRAHYYPLPPLSITPV